MAAPHGRQRLLAATSKHVARLLLTIGENRLELLMVEVQQERDRFLHAVLLALGAAALGLLAGMTLTATMVVLLWPYSHVATLLTLTVLYGTGGFWLGWRLKEMSHHQPLSATLDQLRKDRACLAKILA